MAVCAGNQMVECVSDKGGPQADSLKQVYFRRYAQGTKERLGGDLVKGNLHQHISPSHQLAMKGQLCDPSS